MFKYRYGIKLNFLKEQFCLPLVSIKNELNADVNKNTKVNESEIVKDEMEFPFQYLYIIIGNMHRFVR